MLSERLIDSTRQVVTAELAEKRDVNQESLALQRKRLTDLERQRQKLIDAYMSEALPVTDLKPRQAAIAVAQRGSRAPH